MFPSCGDHACKPLPVEDRVTTDFVWQRSPFQLAGGGRGDIESAGIDCAYRDTDVIESSLEDFTAAGPREVLVRESDLVAARELLGGSKT